VIVYSSENLLSFRKSLSVSVLRKAIKLDFSV